MNESNQPTEQVKSFGVQPAAKTNQDASSTATAPVDKYMQELGRMLYDMIRDWQDQRSGNSFKRAVDARKKGKERSPWI